jgi:putative restriction endonuclease
MSDRHFGHVPGHPPGTWYASRRELYDAGVHRHLQAGIVGSQYEGASSVVLSGGYEDDDDRGDVILYTGEGGRDATTKEQVKHQQLSRGNLALAKSCLQGLPVRVIRGAGCKSRFAPESGYRYEGLYRVQEYWQEPGASDYYVWRFEMYALPGDTILDRGLHVAEEPAAYDAPDRAVTSTLRIVRDTEQARRLKELYDYRCQVCGERMETPAGPYAEAAHIRPLGRPHEGSDVPGNLLCLCPNHHVLFDHHGFAIADDLSLLGLRGHLICHADHTIDRTHLRYRRTQYRRARDV